MQNRSWKYHAIKLFLAAAAVVLAGWSVGHALLAVIIALAIYIAHMHRKFNVRAFSTGKRSMNFRASRMRFLTLY
jgi:hypothetical protein